MQEDLIAPVDRRALKALFDSYWTKGGLAKCTLHDTAGFRVRKERRDNVRRPSCVAFGYCQTGIGARITGESLCGYGRSGMSVAKIGWH